MTNRQVVVLVVVLASLLLVLPCVLVVGGGVVGWVLYDSGGDQPPVERQRDRAPVPGAPAEGQDK
jgi:hypothetical protein